MVSILRAHHNHKQLTFINIIIIFVIMLVLFIKNNYFYK